MLNKKLRDRDKNPANIPVKRWERVIVDIDADYLQTIHDMRGIRTFVDVLNEAIYDWLDKQTRLKNK